MTVEKSYEDNKTIGTYRGTFYFSFIGDKRLTASSSYENNKKNKKSTTRKTKKVKNSPNNNKNNKSTHYEKKVTNLKGLVITNSVRLGLLAVKHILLSFLSLTSQFISSNVAAQLPHIKSFDFIESAENLKWSNEHGIYYY